MKRLDVENTKEYKELQDTINRLRTLKSYYSTNNTLEELNLEGIPLRELFRFMSENGFPKKGFVTEGEIVSYINKIDEEIKRIDEELKNLRLGEIRERKLNSILIIPSWSSVIGYETKGFYLNRPVQELKRDTIVMLSHDIVTVSDKFGTELGMLTGPGIFLTQFSLDGRTYVTDIKEINMLLLPTAELTRLLEAPPIAHLKVDATMNELISIIPFDIIEEAYSKQALLRGIISRNVFHPNKEAFDAFLDIIERPESVNPKEGFKILSAHKEYFNRLLLSVQPQKSEGDQSMNQISAGIAAILTGPKVIDFIDEILPDEKDRTEMLLKFKDIKLEFNNVGKSLITDWL